VDNLKSQQVWTPDHIVEAILDLIPLHTVDWVIEPSAGNGAFLRGLQRRNFSMDKVIACELDPQFKDTLEGFGCDVIMGSFFDTIKTLKLTGKIAVVGNPPLDRKSVV